MGRAKDAEEAKASGGDRGARREGGRRERRIFKRMATRPSSFRVKTSGVLPPRNEERGPEEKSHCALAERLNCDRRILIRNRVFFLVSAVASLCKNRIVAAGEKTGQTLRRRHSARVTMHMEPPNQIVMAASTTSRYKKVASTWNMT
ncbi:hypothetical protein MTO96_008732 [Rhipicephalus appendiculatus]